MFLYQLLSEPLIGSRRSFSPSSTNQRGRELSRPDFRPVTVSSTSFTFCRALFSSSDPIGVLLRRFEMAGAKPTSGLCPARLGRSPRNAARPRRTQLPMPAFDNLLIVVAVAFAAPLLLGFFPSVRLPSVVLEILAGIVIGPS